MRDHGGNLDRAMATFGGTAANWIDLSTGINARPYPVPDLPPEIWQTLPNATSIDRLTAAATQAYRTKATGVPLAGAQAAIQLVPHLLPVGRAAVLGPTYNEHAAALRASGWEVAEVETLEALAGHDLAIVVNPNNPSGKTHDTEELLRLAERVDLLVIDESFADPTPEGDAVQHLDTTTTNILVQRSFGKFYGLAGIRLGFAVTGAELARRVQQLAGPWAVSGPAIEVGVAALKDTTWQADTRARLAAEAVRLDTLAFAAGWDLVGGTSLFRTYATPDASHAQRHLAEHRIWSRRFPYSDTWLRLGLPGQASAWDRLGRALACAGE
ncbi:MAG: threonine-phosphate decarboxylase CobD [Pseudomonadota bacterium]